MLDIESGLGAGSVAAASCSLNSICVQKSSLFTIAARERLTTLRQSLESAVPADDAVPLQCDEEKRLKCCFVVRQL